MAQTRLYVILGSHACRTGMLMLEHKKIPYDLETLPTGAQRMLRFRGWPHGTVPALVIDGERVQTNPAIARKLDEIQPDPPLLPRDPALRAQVEEAERWSDEVFQMSARRLLLAAGLNGPDGVLNRGRDGRLGPLLWRHDRSRYLGTRMLSRFIFNVNSKTAPGLLEELPGQLDRIDAWIEAGVLNGDELNAADFAIGANLALLTYRLDLVDEIERRPLMRLVDRILPAPAQAREAAAASRM